MRALGGSVLRRQPTVPLPDRERRDVFELRHVAERRQNLLIENAAIEVAGARLEGTVSEPRLRERAKKSSPACCGWLCRWGEMRLSGVNTPPFLSQPRRASINFSNVDEALCNAMSGPV